MFRIRAEFNDEMEIGAAPGRVREFFADPLNFVGMMPGVERITGETNGVRRWTIRADVPVIGAIYQMFAVRQTDDGERRVEWGPIADEKKNLLRYAAAFEEAGARTLVRIAQRVELRRDGAKELHLLAGLVGEHRLSVEMQGRVTEMMRAFLQSARLKLEQPEAPA